MLRTSFTIQSTKNSSQKNVAKDAEGGSNNDREDETIKRLSSKNSNGADYQAIDAKKGDIGAKKGNGGARNFRYLISDIKNVFNQLRQAFTKAPIFQHFDLKHHIRIETNISGYAIDEVLSQLISNNLGQ